MPTPTSPSHIDSQNYDTGPETLIVIPGPNAEPFTTPFARSRLVKITNETETLGLENPKGHWSDLTLFATFPFPKHQDQHFFMDGVAKLEEETDWALNIVAVEQKAEVGRLETVTNLGRIHPYITALLEGLSHDPCSSRL